MSKYGFSYIGNKSSIAKWIIDILPPAETFIDLFAGGCAVTHVAMLSGKYKKIIANDIAGTPIIFRDAINGEFNGFTTIPDRESFFLSDDAALKLLYSFGNNSENYLWGKQYELLKVPAERMVASNSVHERRLYYKQFIKQFIKYIHEIIDNPELERKRLYELEGLERIKSLQKLQELQNTESFKTLEITVADYRNVNIPKDSIVYADPPYRNTNMQYGEFDFDGFDNWLNTVNYPVFVSEYDAPKGCVCIAKKERSDHLSQSKVNKKTECIFVQERFAELYKENIYG